MKMKPLVFGLCVSANVSMLLINFAGGVLAFVGHQAVFASAAGVAVNALVVWALIASRDYAEMMHRRADVEIEIAERMRAALRQAHELHVTVGEERSH